MKTFKLLSLVWWLSFSLLACGNSNDGIAPDPTPVPTVDFAKGADIGWVTEMEQKGLKFYNASGVETDCFKLMKELGMTAIRLRVWVEPEDGWNGRDDVVAKAKRAKAEGLDLMLDFHYSDSWADPGQQFKPKAWEGKSVADLKKALADHTKEVLNALKTAGVTPKWVQVGNEIRPGMLWDKDAALSGASYDIEERFVKGSNSTSTEVIYPKNLANLATFITTGYDAVKSVFSDAIVIVHLDNGYDNSLYTWFFDELKKNGGKWDMIGMSIYPYWTMLEHEDYTAEKTIADCIVNVKKVSDRYNCDVMIVETGMECADDQGKLVSATVLAQGKMLMSRLLKECLENTNRRCKGVFYWEPECRPSQYQLGAFTENGRPTVIMDAFK